MTCIRVGGELRLKRSGFVCTDEGPLVDPNPGCRRAAEHTPQPAGYVAWWAWAEEMAKTHEQLQCPGCGRWLICVPRDAAGQETPDGP